MPLTQHGELSIAVIVIFAIAFPFTIWVCKRQGFGRHRGWFYLALLPVARISGSALRIAADMDPKTGIFVASTILNQLGLIPLLLALTGMLERVNMGMGRRHDLSHRAFWFCHTVALICLILAIVGSVYQSNLHDPDQVRQGQTLRKAASILLLFVWAVLCAITLTFIARVEQIWEGDRRIVYAAISSAPFLLVRLVYSVLGAFSSRDSRFSSVFGDIYILAFMQIVMEAICLILFTVAGLTAPPMKAGPEAPGKTHWFLGGRRHDQTNKPEHARSGYAQESYTGQNQPGELELGTLPHRT